jgi:hypothetical protein
MTSNETTPEEAAQLAAKKKRKKRRDNWYGGIVLSMIVVILTSMFYLVSQMPGDSDRGQLLAAHSRALSQFKFCTNEMVNDLQVVEDKRAAVTPLVQSAVVGGYGVGEELDYERLRADIAAVYPKGGDDTRALMALTLCQEKFLQEQKYTTQYAESFERWRDGLWFDWLDFQTDQFRVFTDGKILRGQTALDYLKQPIGPNS